ncbi:hypothetical protein EUX98_g7496 [Antrodiella citrinella]|uniref:Major facilitator superfamily (MFS) profile domain-containing protein n=1 Tax=Antrodiella citrinella TaxID=2447956 RepID=A0A4S4MLD4_9APHY|nr:hypothetical protein EUX98_g7496 [Antrodiella citrinella]
MAKPDSSFELHRDNLSDTLPLDDLPKLELQDGQTPSSLLRKVDLRLMPIMLACYTLQFIDKGILNYANIMGLQQDTGLHGNQFSWLATAFFMVFALAQLPGIYILSRVPVNIYLGCGMLLCTIGVACTAACNSYGSLVAVRVILAVGESTMSPSLSLITMKWYTKGEASRRYGVWYSGLGLGQIIGGLISFGFQHVHRGSFGSWRGMFLVCGLLNLLVTIWTYFCLTDNPSHARWLAPAEQRFFTTRLLHANKYNVSTRLFSLRQVRSTLTSDLAIWLAFLLAASCSIQSGAITTFSATLITGFGYTPKQAALLNMPSGAAVATLCLVVPAVTGACLMSFTNVKGALLAGIWLINTVTPILIVAISWTQANCAGHTKRVTYNAMIMIAFGIGNICGPQTFRAKDAPKYWPARVTMVAATAVCGLLTVLLLGLYMWRNETRKPSDEDEKTVYEDIDERTDFDIAGFRYVY